MIRHRFIKLLAFATILAGSPWLAWGQAIPQAERGTLIQCNLIEYTFFSENDIFATICDRPSKANSTSRLEGEYLFRAEGAGGKHYETRFGPGRPHPDYPTHTSGAFAIPEPENWTGFSIFHGRKLIFSYTVKVIPSVVSKLRPISLKPSKKTAGALEGAVSTSRTVDWGGATPDSAYIRYSLDQGRHWGSISNFVPDHPTFEMPEQILKINPHPIMEIHAQYGFVKRVVQHLIWNDPQDSK